MNKEEKRQNAMKNFFKSGISLKYNYHGNLLKYPCKGYEYNDNIFNLYCDGYALILTKENIPIDMEYQEAKDINTDLFDRIIKDYIDNSELTGKADIDELISKAKKNGYKRSKKYIKPEYFALYDGSFYNIKLLDRAYSIICDGTKATIYIRYLDVNKVLILVTTLGHAIIMPINMEQKQYDEIKKREDETEKKYIYNINIRE